MHGFMAGGGARKTPLQLRLGIYPFAIPGEWQVLRNIHKVPGGGIDDDFAGTKVHEAPFSHFIACGIGTWGNQRANPAFQGLLRIRSIPPGHGL